MLLAVLTLPVIGLFAVVYKVASGHPWSASAYLVYGLLFRSAGRPRCMHTCWAKTNVGRGAPAVTVEVLDMAWRHDHRSRRVGGGGV